MKRKEILMEKIEKERRKLDTMLETGSAESAYAQSLVVDELIERYLAM